LGNIPQPIHVIDIAANPLADFVPQAISGMTPS
jgi:hypothetical protein